MSHKINIEMIDPSVFENPEIGDLSQLETETKDTLVGAINSLVETKIDNINNRKLLKQSIGDPVTEADSIPQICSKLDIITDSFKNKLIDVGVKEDLSEQKISNLVNKIPDIRVNPFPSWHPTDDIWINGAGSGVDDDGGASAAICNGKIYVFGGYKSPSHNGKTRVYDPDNNTWDISKAPMPKGCSSSQAVTINDNIYVMGGYYATSVNSGYTLSTMYMYNTLSDSYTTLPNLPSASSTHFAVNINNKIYLIISGEHKMYDETTQTWTNKTREPRGEHNQGYCSLGTKGYLIGGNTNSGDYGTNTNIEYDSELDNWTIKKPMPTGRRDVELVGYKGYVYAMGGCMYADLSGGYTNKVERYKVATDEWETVIDPPVNARGMATPVAIDDHIFLIGGGKTYCYLIKK